MKVVPLARKVRELARGREVRVPANKDRMRWAAVVGVFVLTVLITAPAVWVSWPWLSVPKSIPTELNAEIHAPIVAQVAFELVQTGDEKEWEERREREFKRIFRFDTRVRDNGIARVQRILTAAYEGAQQGEDTAAIASDLRAIDAQIAIWPEEELRALITLSLDERFRRNAERILDEVYSKSYLVTSADWTRYDALREQAVVETIGVPHEEVDQVRIHPEDTDIAVRNLIRRHMAAPIRMAAAGEASDADVLATVPGEAAFRVLKLGLDRNFYYDQRRTQESFASFERDPPVRTAVTPGMVVAPWLEGADESSPRLAAMRWPHKLDEFEAQLAATYSQRLSQSLTHQWLRELVAQTLFVLITFLIITFFVIKFSRELAFTTHTVLLLSLPVLLALGLGRVFLLLGGDAASIAGYAFPAGVIGILGVLLLDVRLAILLVTWGCVLFGLEANLRYEFVIVGLLGGYTGVAALYTFRERREVLYAGLLIGLVNGWTILNLSYIGDTTQQAWAAAAIGAMSGVLCSLISFAVLPVFEVAFHVTTDMRLLELSGLQHPLLREMEERAPGTLQHTMNVAKLAESAATAIGVNYLLVRAGVYFHDIGKMSKPEYFTENQLTPEDKRRHEALTPHMSTLIVKNHVKEGLELARKYRLPKVVVDFIPEHHGTSLIQYFHQKAVQAHEKGEMKEPVREEDFRYPGPKPQSIESAIVMLADTVEATATARLSGRAVRDDDIQKLVRQAITDKFNDGQFDDCNLTLRDLNTIRESFVKTLRSRFHARIDYPQARRPEPPRREGPAAPKPDEKSRAAAEREQISREIATGA